MSTETISPRFADLDAWATGGVLDAMFEGQLTAVAAVRPALPALAAAIDAAAARIGAKGRLVYVGAGTSGRIGVQDGAELTPTFGWPERRVVFAIAGGIKALTAAIEGAEDDAKAGARHMDTAGVAANDIVIGVAASGATPFTVAAVARAKSRGALTIGIASNAATPLLAAAEHPVLIDTGPEVIAGSTRMKAGTAQKIALNLFSSALMVRLGRVHGGIMIEMRATNAKLERRAAAIVARVAGCDTDAAERALKRCKGDIKSAVLVARGATAKQAATLLKSADGNLRQAMAALRA